MTDDFFRNRLNQMIDLRHPLAVLANRMPRQEIQASLAQRWVIQVKTGRKIEDLTRSARLVKLPVAACPMRAGQDRQILAQRHAVYLQAHERNPSRWSRHPRNWEPIEAVALNPERDEVVSMAVQSQPHKKVAVA